MGIAVPTWCGDSRRSILPHALRFPRQLGAFRPGCLPQGRAFDSLHSQWAWSERKCGFVLGRRADDKASDQLL